MEQKVRADRSLGRAIRRYRMERGWTQEQAAAHLQLEGCNITRGAYSKIEAGIQGVTVTQLAAITRAFRISYNELFDDR